MDTDAAALELIVLSVKETAARCRVLGTQEPLTLRTSGLWRVAPMLTEPTVDKLTTFKLHGMLAAWEARPREVLVIVI
jgi:hypothetical protein